MRCYRRPILGIVMLCLSSAAQAQTVNGPYVAGGIGGNWRSETSDTLNNLVFLPSGTTIGDGNKLREEYKTGGLSLASVGWGFGNGFRAEIEGSYRNNRVAHGDWDFFGTRPGPLTDNSGSVATTALMANVLYDFHIGPVTPYIGGGVGYGRLRFDNVGGDVNTITVGDHVKIDGSQARLAYQGIVGLALPVTSVPGLAITAEFRYFATEPASISGQLQQATGLGTADYSVHASNENQSVLFGLRYNFGK